MKEYIFYKFINGNKFSLSHFSLTDAFSDNQELIAKVDHFLDQVSIVENTDFLVETELNEEVVSKSFFSNAHSFYEAFIRINSMFLEAFQTLLGADETSMLQMNRTPLLQSDFPTIESILESAGTPIPRSDSALG